jgi:hypothetical protein
MRASIWFALTLVAALAACGDRAALAAPPQALYGKSVVVSWTEERMQRRQGEGEFRPATRHGSFSVYVSSAGRVFNRARMTNPRRGQSGETERVGDTKNRNVAFDGRSMVVTQHGAAGGARRIVASFDDGFAGCNAQVIRGKEEGASAIVARSTITPGRTVEISSVTTSGVSCTVKNGNVFGSE